MLKRSDGQGARSLARHRPACPRPAAFRPPRSAPRDADRLTARRPSRAARGTAHADPRPTPPPRASDTLCWLRSAQSVVSPMRQFPAVNVTTSYRYHSAQPGGPSIVTSVLRVDCPIITKLSVLRRPAGRFALPARCQPLCPGARDNGGPGLPGSPAARGTATVLRTRRKTRRAKGAGRGTIRRSARGTSTGMDNGCRAARCPFSRRSRARPRPRARSRRWSRGTSPTAAPRSRARPGRGRTGSSRAARASPTGPRIR
jgi:hypothetical protein